MKACKITVMGKQTTRSDKQINKQTNRKTRNRQTDRQTDRQTTGKGVGAWISAIPFSACFAIDSCVYRLVCKLRLGLPFVHPNG